MATEVGDRNTQTTEQINWMESLEVLEGSD